jgi:hypothetical protein
MAAAAPLTAECDDLIAALRLALPYVQKVASTAPTTFSREQRRLQACKDARAIQAVLAQAEAR